MDQRIRNINKCKNLGKEKRILNLKEITNRENLKNIMKSTLIEHLVRKKKNKNRSLMSK
jgi:hypothetical protein